MSKSITILIFYTIAMLQIKLLTVGTRMLALAEIVLAINVLALSLKLIPLTPLKPIAIVTIALIVARCLHSMLTVIQTIYDAVLVHALLVDSNLNSALRLYSRTSKNDYCLNRQNLILFYPLPFPLSTRGASQKSTNLATGMSTIENTCCTCLNIRIAGSRVTPASAMLHLTLKYVCKPRTYRGFSLSSTLNTKALHQKIYEPPLIHQIIPKLVDSLTQLYDRHPYYVGHLPIVLV